MNEKGATVMRLFLEPADVALFRDGRSFTAGSDHRARSLFPPNPSTVLGALRCKLLMDTGVSLTAFAHGAPEAQVAIEQMGTRDGAPPFALRGPFIAQMETNPNKDSDRQVQLYYPSPADLVKIDQKYHLLKPIAPGETLPFEANWPNSTQNSNNTRFKKRFKLARQWVGKRHQVSVTALRPLWFSNAEKQVEAEGWLDEQTLQAYLNHTVLPDEFSVWRDEQLFARESRFGVAIDSRRKRYKDGMLYQIEFIRPREGVGLVVDVVKGAPSLDQQGLLSIGGESRAFHYYRLDIPREPVQPPGERFKIYFATPAYFKGGWLPAQPWSKWFDGEVRLVAVALRRARTISGVKVDTRSQQEGTFIKAGHKFVPPGSVYYFEATRKVTYSGEPISEFGDNQANSRAGYGSVLFGQWDYLTWRQT